MRIRAPFAVLACLLGVLALPAAAHEATPPNRNDPCAGGVKNICGTTGVGSYKTGRYGVRWYGSFKGAVSGAGDLYCIDLRFWYPSAAYRYRQDTSGQLTNKEGDTVPIERMQRIAYAVWRFGRTDDANQAAATMLYVHTLMGDGRPGELDPSAVNPAVETLFARIASDSALYHGPYRVEVRSSGALTVGKPSVASIRVLSASGNAVPGVALTVDADGVSGGAKQTRTGAGGGATVAFTPASSSPKLTVRASGLPSTMPAVYAPTTAAAAANGQRLIAPESQDVIATTKTAASKRQIGITTAATPSVLAIGATSTDAVTLTGAAAGWKATVSVRIYGPFAALARARCDGAPAWQGSFATNGSATYTTPPAKLSKAGWYTYVEVVPSDAVHNGITSACAIPVESFRVQADPKLSTVISAQKVAAGTSIYDRIHVEGLAGMQATIAAALYGPYAAANKATCDGAPVWSGQIVVSADGDYNTATFVPTLPGYYTYREQIVESELIKGVQTACADVAETALVVVKPVITTAVSTQAAMAGSSVVDKVVVSGLGPLPVSVKVELFGPFSSLAAVKCNGTPFTVQTLPVPGDGTYLTSPARLDRAGVYTYRASIAPGALNDGYTSDCGETAETVVITSPPPPPPPPPPSKPKPPAQRPVFKPPLSLTTVVSHEVARAGSAIFDRIRTKGVRGAVRVELYGPFATRAGIACGGKAVWTGRVTVRADGEIRSPLARVLRPGFYGFREKVMGPGGTSRLVTACAIEVETSLVAPKIITGRGDRARYVPVPGVGAPTPTRVLVPSLGIDVPIAPVGIDVAGGVLGVPTSIHRTGWWRDGTATGASGGSILIAGHVDSAAAGAGAFYKLHRVTAGSRIEIRTAGGGTRAYRVVSVRNYPKTALPTSVWSKRGPARLVLVTCGGPFDRKTGHYRDNVVVTALPF